MDDVVQLANEVNGARKEFVEKHKGLPPVQRMEAMLADIYGLLYVELYVRRRE
jgi:hypothetical protein